MKQLLGAALAVALLAPGAAFAAEATGPVKTWDAGTKTLTLRLGLTEPFTEVSCKIANSITVPATLAAGRNVAITYSSAGGVNTCTQLSLN